MGYAGSNGLEPQQFVSNNQPCGYICYGFGEFDGQGSGHDFSGNVRAASAPCWNSSISLNFVVTWMTVRVIVTFQQAKR